MDGDDPTSVGGDDPTSLGGDGSILLQMYRVSSIMYRLLPGYLSKFAAADTDIHTIKLQSVYDEDKMVVAVLIGRLMV